MATQATLAVLRKKKKRDRQEQEFSGEDAGEMERPSARGFPKVPSWYPYSRTSRDEQVEELVTKVQAAFRGHRARKMAQVLMKKKVLVSKNGLEKGALEIKQLHQGWKRFCNHVVLLLLMSWTIWLQTLHFEPKSASVEYNLVSVVRKAEFGSGSTFEDVATLRDVIDFVFALLPQVYAVDPSFNRSVLPEFCNGFESCETTDWRGILRNCSFPTEFSGFTDQFNRQQFGLGIIQKRFAMGSCESNLGDLYTVLGLVPEHEDIKCAFEDLPEATIYDSVTMRQNPELFEEFLGDEFLFDPRWQGFLFGFDAGVSNLRFEAVECHVDFILNTLNWLDHQTKETRIAMIHQNRNGDGLYSLFDIRFEADISGNVRPRLISQSAVVLDFREQINVTIATSFYLLFTLLNLELFSRDFLRYMGRTWTCKQRRRSKRHSFLHLCFESFILAMHFSAIISYWLYVSQCQDFDPFPSGETPLSEGLGMIVDLANLSSRIRNLYGIIIIFMTVRTIMYLDFHDDTAFVTRTLSRAWFDLVTFCLIYFFVVVSYSFVGVLLFSPNGQPFRTIPQSIQTLLFVSLGEFEKSLEVAFDPFLSSRSFLVQLFYWSFTILTSLILFNVLLSIIIESFVTYQDRKRAQRGIPFVQSFFISFDIITYDFRKFYLPLAISCCCCYWPFRKREMDGTKHDGNVVMDDSVFGEELGDLVTNPNEFVAFLNSPHKYLHRLRFLRLHMKQNVPTFVLRREFGSVFSLRNTERILWLMRERTGQLRPLGAEREIGFLFFENQSQLYLIDRLNTIHAMLETLSWARPPRVESYAQNSSSMMTPT